MTHSTTHVDTLRERLLKPELDAARSILAKDGLPGLLAAAEACLREVNNAGARFEALAQGLENAPAAERFGIISKYLRESVADPAKLAGDLRALARNDTGVLDLAALGERTARQSDALECRAEACLALARATPARFSSAHLEPLLALAAMPGRWSRRLEAIRGLASLRFSASEGGLRERMLAMLTDLTSRGEQRWVQPAALAALAAHESTAASGIARERLARPATGDDFLVRAGIVLLIGLKKCARWPDVLTLAHDDPSEHVRITAARVQHSAQQLERVAQADASHRVRASALIRLARRHGRLAIGALRTALAQDAHAFVVLTATEELARLARRDTGLIDDTVLAAVATASERGELSGAARSLCREALVELRALRALSPSVLDELRRAVDATPIGGSSAVTVEEVVRLDDEALSQALVVVARDDFGIGVDRFPTRLLLHRGERTVFSLWRALFELRHPAPDKRQGFSHVEARRLPGALRSPPGGLAEVTATRVPGQRVIAGNRGEWGRELPRVEDLMSQVLRASVTQIASAAGIATVSSPASFAGRMRGFLNLRLHYARLAESRQRALESEDPLVRASYARDVFQETGITLELVPYAFDMTTPRAARTPTPPRELGSAIAMVPFGLSLSSPAQSLTSAWERLRDLVSPAGDIGLSHLAGFGALLLGALLTRQAVIRHNIDAERLAIPLVIGGWGTRGKSGSERLKAALFQGLGYECLVKTTGCEAMFIHAIPGLPAREVFIYRPYDKATVWEQRSVLALAGRLRVRVFLWECMALQPELVNLLQHQWMRDDCSTITNTYPDHEDIQGPTGLDVAQTISEFVPHSSTVITSEVQMLPLLKARAATRGTRVIAVLPRAAELIADDLNARFGHAEHPTNIALVAALARRAGVSETVAIAEMADHVVADLGALKTYPTVEWLGRRLSFTNGMGANDRAATLENWRRAGFDSEDSAKPAPGWIMTVVNNRADRPARTGVFGELLVKDIAADRHMLIGTNLPGLLRAIERALDEHVRTLSPLRDLPEDPSAHGHAIKERLARAFARLCIGGTDDRILESESARLNVTLPPREVLQRLLTPSGAESYEAARARVEQGLIETGEREPCPFLVSFIAKRRLLLVLQQLACEPSARASLDALFAAAYRAIFREGLVPLADASISGDGIIESLAVSIPKGASGRVMGMQNIKGTGLDFVYRWVSIETVTKICARLASDEPTLRQQALVSLMVHDDYGVVDASFALQAVRDAAARDPGNPLPYEAAINKLDQVLVQRGIHLRPQREHGWGARLRRLVGETFDFVDAIRRRDLAGRVLDALAREQISHATAALRMRRILQRAKGGWFSNQAH